MVIDASVLDAMPRVERVHHRNCSQGSHYRKVPIGEDRPDYFSHLAEVARMLQEVGLAAETVAAGYLRISQRYIKQRSSSFGIVVSNSSVRRHVMPI